jgi:type IV fimbrial biogenesis protein FimT
MVTIMRGRARQRGFSLVELMIGLILVAALMGIGIPSFRAFIVKQQLVATSTDLHIALITARSEALKRNRSVSLTPEADGWGAGWIIPSPNLAEPDILHHVQSGDITIDVSEDVRFSPTGRVVMPPGTNVIEFEIVAGPDSGATACVELQRDGRTSYCRQGCPIPSPMPESCRS